MNTRAIKVLIRVIENQIEVNEKLNRRIEVLENLLGSVKTNSPTLNESRKNGGIKKEIEKAKHLQRCLLAVFYDKDKPEISEEGFLELAKELKAYEDQYYVDSQEEISVLHS